MRSPGAAGRPRRIRAARSVDTWAGPPSARRDRPSASAPSGIPCAAVSPDHTDAAKVVVLRRPGADLVAGRLQRRGDAGLETWLEMDDACGRVQPRPGHRGLG